MSTRRTTSKAKQRPRQQAQRINLQELVKLLRVRIANQDIPPASRLREQDMAEELGISRAHARDVLDALVYLGFAERTPNKGVVVPRLTRESILQLFEVREINEGLCARLAALNSRPGDWDDLILLFGKPTEEALARGDFAAYEENYTKLWRRILEASGNPFLVEILQKLYEKTHIYGRRLIVFHDRAQVALREHRALLEALRAGKAEEAARLRRTTMANLRTLFDRHSSYLL